MHYYVAVALFALDTKTGRVILVDETLTVPSPVDEGENPASLQERADYASVKYILHAMDVVGETRSTTPVRKVSDKLLAARLQLDPPTEAKGA